LGACQAILYGLSWQLVQARDPYTQLRPTQDSREAKIRSVTYAALASGNISLQPLPKIRKIRIDTIQLFEKLKIQVSKFRAKALADEGCLFETSKYSLYFSDICIPIHPKISHFNATFSPQQD
jgi:hypothetical protein